MDWVLIGAILFEIVVLAPLYLMFTELTDNLLLISADPELSAVIDRVQRAGSSRCRPSPSEVIAVRWHSVVGPAAAGHAAQRGGRDVPVAVRRAAGRRPGCAAPFAAAAVDRRLFVGRRAGRVPGRSAAIQARQGRVGRSVRPAADDAARTTARRAGRVLGDPDLVIAFPRADGSGYVDADGRAVSLPAGRAARSPYDGRRQRRGTGGRPDLRPVAGRRSRTGRGGGRRCHGRAGEPAPARRGAGPARRTAILPRTHHHRLGRRTAPDRAEPA